jgi:serine/threonine-protein kinase ULK4
MQSYHLYEVLGRGEETVVYKARRKKSINYFAVKSVSKHRRAHVMAEVQALRALTQRSAFVLGFTAWYETTNHLWLVLEHCVGADLGSVLSADSRLPERTIAQLAFGLSSALAASHASGILHCDLRPANVLLDELGEPRLFGFGSSRRIGSSKGLHPLPPAHCDTNLDADATASAFYMAPELFLDGGVFSTCSDLYALGGLLFECSTGSPPFRSSSLPELVQSALHDDPPRQNDSSSNELSDLITRLLSKDPSARLTWPSLCAHAFWLGSRRPPELPMPDEPELSAFLAKQEQRDARTSHATTAFGPSHNAESEEFSTSTQNDSTVSALEKRRNIHGSVDISRVSQLTVQQVRQEDENECQGSSESSFELESGAQYERATNNVGGESPSGEEEEALGNPGGAQRSDVYSLTPERCFKDSPSVPATRSACPTSDAQETTDPLHKQLSRRDHRPASTGGRRRAQALSRSTSRDAPLAANPTLFHTSDFTIKPIANSKRIEQPMDSTFEAKRLPVRALSAHEMLELNHDELEAFVHSIYSAIAGQLPPAEKLNLLTYFETLCCDQKAANFLVNSSLMALFLKQARSSSTAAIRARILSAFATLSRHASYIGETLLGDISGRAQQSSEGNGQQPPSSSKALVAMQECAKDKHPPARRKAVACLGELVFYVISQDEGQISSGEKVRGQSDGVSKALSTLVRIARSSEDQVCQHYGIKALENIFASSSKRVEHLTTLEVASSLLSISQSGAKHEHLRTTAASALMRGCSRSQPLLQQLTDKAGAQAITSLVHDGSLRIQQSGLTLLCMALNNPTARFKASIRSGKRGNGLAQALLQSAGCSVPIVCAKALLAISLLWQTSPEQFKETFVPHLVTNVEKLSRGGVDDYMQSCLASLQKAGVDCAIAELDALRQNQENLQGQDARADHRSLREEYQATVLVLVSDNFNHEFFARGEAVIASLAEALVHLRGRELGTSLLEAALQVSGKLLKYIDALLRCFIPQLMLCLNDPATRDERFLALKLMCDTLLPLLSDEILLTFEHNASSKANLRSVIADGLIPSCPTLFFDDDPTPLYSLKLLGAAVEYDPSLIREATHVQLEQSFFNFLHLDDGNNNVHNLRLCLHTVRSEHVSSGRLSELEAPQRLVDVLVYAFDNAVEPFLWPALAACKQLLEQDKGQTDQGNFAQTMVQSSYVFLELIIASDEELARNAASCLRLLSDLAGDEALAKQLLLSDISLARLPVLLQQVSERQEGVPHEPMDVLCECMERLVWTEAAAGASRELWKELARASMALEQSRPESNAAARLAKAVGG